MSTVNTRVQKWGNSLALRIPKLYAQQLGLSANNPVHISLDGERLIIEPAPRPALDDLLAEITPDNLHNEIDTGDAVGNEVW